MTDTNKTGVTSVLLRPDGVLWALNAHVFHPRGFALAQDTVTGELSLIGDGTEVWVFAEETAEDGFQKFEALLARRRADLADQAAPTVPRRAGDGSAEGEATP